LDLPGTLLVSTPLGKSVEAGKYIPGCVMKVGKEELPGYLIMMPFEDYDLILRMDWLSEHHARVDCKEKLVQFVRPRKDMLEFKGNRVKELKYLISGAKAQKFIKKGCQRYLAYMINKPKGKSTLEGTMVVKEYLDVFLEEMSILPPPRDMEFAIDLVPTNSFLELHIVWLR
jgi:hypothetical protein